MTRVFDILFALLPTANPWPGLVALSLATAAVALLIFRYTSNQRRIRQLKDQIVSHLLEVLLYRDELRVVARAQARLAIDNLRYLGHALVPLVFMVVPVGLVVIQADLRYGRRPLRPGESAVVTVRLKPSHTSLDDAALKATPGIAVDTPAVRMPTLGEVSWRIRAIAPGASDLQVTVAGATAAKRVVVSPCRAAPSPLRTCGTWQRLLHPGEPALSSDGPIEWISVSYPEASVRLLGRRVRWIWPFFALTLVFGYALKGPLRVQL